MSAAKIRNGFEYTVTQTYPTWDYSFAPIGAKVQLLFTGTKVRKADLFALLDDRESALDYYLETRARYGDVERALKNVERAKQSAAARRERDPDSFDPGGRRNNPGAVSRDLREAARDIVQEAKDGLAVVTAWKSRLDADPFDVVAWREKYLPCVDELSSPK